METNSTPALSDTALLVHIEHSKPIEVGDFVASFKALNYLYCSFLKKKGQTNKRASLYVEKVEKGSIDFFLCDVALGSVIPLMENLNTILEFANYLKNVFIYFIKGNGECPKLTAQECSQLSDVVGVVASDNKANMQINVVNKNNGDVKFYGCNFTFAESNSMQNQLRKMEDGLKNEVSDADIHNRVMMVMYQVRSENASDKGNLAIIEEICEGKHIPVVFASDELKNKVLYSEDNPTQKAFQVDIQLQTVGGKIIYKVLALHDVVDLGT